MSAESHYGVHRVVRNLRETLQAYLEAQYHIKNPCLIAERRRLLERPGTIHQLPYVEATPTYASGVSYTDLHIANVAKRLLAEVAGFGPDVGIFPSPFAHQSKALEAFLGRGEDLVVATGTGSGKTESFLMPILGSLAIEAAERPVTARMPGFRALLVYPMNALVNDQVARIRKLFGDPRVAELLKKGRGRIVRFGSYTGRTSYPGERTPSKDARYIQPMFEDFYLKYLANAGKLKQLSEKGRWPSKDLERFYAKDRAEARTYRSGRRSGKPRTKHNWNERLHTQEGDRELLPRHEMQASCPDLLITNYSMLEYMLLRPIERPIFQQTKDWLSHDDTNELIVVLDEAHIYRGAAGAEVALLLRRLQARLGLPRERVRYILTSASLGEGKEAEQAVVQFARDLSGLPSTSKRKITLVTGEREPRFGQRAGNAKETSAFAEFDLRAFNEYSIHAELAATAVRDLATSLGWPAPPPDETQLANWLYSVLEGFGPAEEAVRSISGNAIELTELGEKLFPSGDAEARRCATDALLALGTFARRESDKRVFLPTRLHLFYRGLPGLFVCVDRRCDARLNVGRSPEEYLLGRLHTEPRTHCECRARARVFELLTHRDCGTAFLRGYIRGTRGDFLWHEPSNDVGAEEADPLHEVHLLVEGSPHPDAVHETAQRWLEVSSGRMQAEAPSSTDGFLQLYFPTGSATIVRARPLWTFARCPVCLRRLDELQTKIMDLATKGEAPFANLVKVQVISQPPRVAEGPEFPNGGRKSLLFSDGRQKAARLARDIPREVELDSFRQALALAANLLVADGREARPTRELYVAFVAVAAMYNLQLFDRDDQRLFVSHQSMFRNWYSGDAHQALADNWDVPYPKRYREALLRQLCNPFYSLHASTIGFVVPVRHAMGRLEAELGSLSAQLQPGEIRAIACSWIAGLLSEFAFDKDISGSQRQTAAGYQRGSWGGKGTLRGALEEILTGSLSVSPDGVSAIAKALQTNLCDTDRGLFFLNPNRISILVDLERSWYQCQACTFLSPVVLAGRCVHCGASENHALDPHTSDYIRARKGFWRNPLVDSLAGRGRPRHITAEEHTAQLSQRDAGVVQATTEKYELRFQDVVIGEDEGPIDVLSCTTTMEVGIDIGSLIAVGLRNVPPQRENYQQRAGRSGRRGSAVSTVMTYGQGGHHDSYYFHNPVTIVSGAPRRPVVKIDNPKICRRHVHSFLFQTFFHEAIDRGVPGVATQSAVINRALGRTEDFFAGPPGSQVNLEAFAEWVGQNILTSGAKLLQDLVAWIPEAVSKSRKSWVQDVAEQLLEKLRDLKTDWMLRHGATPVELAGEGSDPEEDEAGEDAQKVEEEKGDSELLSFLFDRSLLPTYAFPTDLCSFLVEEISRKGGRTQVVAKEKPQQAIAKALSEYAPGRLIVIDKRTYRSGGVTASSLPSEIDRAAALFSRGLKPYIYCRACAFVQDPDSAEERPERCPLCHGEIGAAEMLQPEVFHPEEARETEETDRDQEFTYATVAQFPVPAGESDLGEWQRLGNHGKYTHSADRKLVVVNRGRRSEDTGFAVCTKCGAAKPEGTGDSIAPRHNRPYLVQTPNGHQPRPCDGQIRTVFLGHTFRSDLLLIRVKLQSPIGTNMGLSLVRSVLEDSLRSISDALLLAASRFLDIDPSEFNAGYRIVPGPIPAEIWADIYLFDTLAGGAGYSDQAGLVIEDILSETVALLTGCPSRCDRSCYQCLRHYANQYWHSRLDRHLAAALLMWMRRGGLPSTGDLNEQSRTLEPLRRMMELEGFDCTPATRIGGIDVPLALRHAGRTVAVGCYHGLLDGDSKDFVHPLRSKLAARKDVQVHLVNEYLLSRNLPTAYQQIRRVLVAPR